MSVPRDAEVYNAILRVLRRRGQEIRVAELDRGVADSLELAPEQLRALKRRLVRARAELRDAGLVESPRRGWWSLTERGRATERIEPSDLLHGATERRAATEEARRNAGPGLLRASIISDALRDPEERQKLRLPADDDTPMPVVCELNLRHPQGLQGADKRFEEMYGNTLGQGAWRERPPRLIANTYYRCDLTMNEVRTLVRRDSAEVASRARAIFRVWPDFPVRRMTDRSVVTVKADAARRSYDASGADIAWAVIDSGIDAMHPHFRAYSTLGGDVAELHRDFTRPTGTPIPAQVSSALTDKYGHGTHVARIIAGALIDPERPQDEAILDSFKVGQRSSVADETAADGAASEFEQVEERSVGDPRRLTGVAPRCTLVSLKVLDDNGESRSTDVIRALQYVREEINGSGRRLRVQGVNLSLGYEFSAKWFACGQSPICIEVDKLVRSGVVVVVAAGNTGYGELTSREGVTSTGLALTINDTGNAELAVTVGATHRDSPYTYGVSFFSSKGPTGDGRMKPDLVAPGERITSCAAGKRLTELRQIYGGVTPSPGAAAYIDDSGTSMAAPHVSGAIAAFLSIRREFIGQPERVKRIFMENATPLGRDRSFEGRGLVDLMRPIQSV